MINKIVVIEEGSVDKKGEQHLIVSNIDDERRNSTWAAWLYDLLKPHVAKLVVCDPRRNALLQDGNQNDRVDARKLSGLPYMSKLKSACHGDHGPPGLESVRYSALF